MATIDIIIIVVYLSAIVVVGLVMQKKASAGIDSYFLGNRKLPWWALGASGMASNTDIAGTMINTAFIYALGTKGFFIEIRGGVTLIMAFLMVFMGKWNRRSQVMTQAEWMHFRFGTKKEGDVARIISAIAAIIMTVAMVTYFVIGAGKFIGDYLGIEPLYASILMIILAMTYTLASGLYGVVWTDVFQGIFIFGVIIYISVLAMTTVDLPDEFLVSVPMMDGSFTAIKTTLAEWSRMTPPQEMNMPEGSTFSIYNLFGIAIMFYLFKVTLEGASGAGGYMLQRYFAARSDREAGLLSLFWTCLLAFRWPLIASFAMLGIYHGIETGTVIADPELVLPTVIKNYIPVGVKGFLIAGLMAAAMSTFDSTVNAGAAYWVKDLYQTYLRPNASEKDLILQSRLASLVIVLLALLFSLTISNINEIWGWITMGIGAGMFIPQVIRWYWWRFNGYGFAIGTAVGMIAAVLTKGFGGPIAEYNSFLIASGSSLVGCILGTYLTPPTESAVLSNFYKVTRPFGFWGSVRTEIPTDVLHQINEENRRDIIAIFFAVPWQVVLFLTGMMIVMKQWSNVFNLFGLLVVLSAGLYWFWYRHLSKEVRL
ncbi:MAG: sodium:solute symporter [Candidatus Marinimicrobia bacterium]|jgi:solute:Na+ symporter, SSS family|nr:sodium:solute symporter [Candidatus Neomarinimicrobiota bacterium]MBT3848059.1 sodium:solute symporter [Candidatus Neomarinimicrobiota bacterium]MBT4054886.1 sodium:solute symporter [Candidatus Neomarinimicrobiota bacterium]MBT4368938.1 sodium:solute symporter [Candidatus Neomarinimicrobiota bacterium]MBT4662969.1 sodium:solute symporter [Candidatus Neomarinimicrobiota bacterium]